MPSFTDVGEVLTGTVLRIDNTSVQYFGSRCRVIVLRDVVISQQRRTAELS